MEPNYCFTKEELEMLLENAMTRAIERYENGKKSVYLSRDEVARRLGVDKSTLWRWNRSGYLKVTHFGSKCVYREDVVSKLEKGGKNA